MDQLRAYGELAEFSGDVVTASDPTPASAAPRNFLIVTAPFGPFSRELAAALRAGGALCRRVLMNAGDISEWGLAQGVLYSGKRDAWKGWLRTRLIADGVTDLITHGDSQSYAAEAIEAAHELGIAVHVFEQGYFRPHWVTLERDGVNARSNLSRARETYSRVVTAPELAAPTEVGRITPAAVRRIASYHFWSFLGRPLLPGYRDPYPYAPAAQAFSHVRRYVRQRFLRRWRLRGVERVFDGSPVFLALLQRPGDSQLTRHSAFGTSGDFIRFVVASFAADAPAGARLLFKSHPLDHGLEPHGRIVRDAAKVAGIADRVFFADDGHFPSMIQKSHAVLSVNSTGGLSALEAGLPTIVLGDAIYDIDGLTHQGGLESFWKSPRPPEPDLFRSYRAAVMAACQINGAFSTRDGIRLVVPEAARRLLHSPNGQ